MNALAEPKDYLQHLKEDKLFQQWQENNSQSYLSHFFIPLSSEFKVKGQWEVGFYNPADDKITTFTQLKEDFEIKPADDVFKKQADKVEQLKLEDIKINLEKSGDLFKENVLKIFPEATLGDGFLILQKFKGKIIWNYTFITKALKFINLKIDALNGEVEHETVNLIDQGNKQ